MALTLKRQPAPVVEVAGRRAVTVYAFSHLLPTAVSDGGVTYITTRDKTECFRLYGLALKSGYRPGKVSTVQLLTGA